MTYSCIKCDKIFNREIDLERHNNRKIPCDRKLQCQRCFKEFKLSGDLKRHMYKKNKCYDKRSDLELVLKIEETKMVVAKTNLELEKEKNKSKMACRDINITINNNITNINKFTVVPMSWNKSYDVIKDDDVIQTTQNVFRYQYNNDGFPEDRCIIIKDGQIFGIKDGKLKPFDEIREYVNENIRQQVSDLQRYFALDEDIQIAFNITRKTLPERKTKLIDKLYPFVSNSRNQGIVKKQLILAME